MLLRAVGGELRLRQRRNPPCDQREHRGAVRAVPDDGTALARADLETTLSRHPIIKSNNLLNTRSPCRPLRAGAEDPLSLPVSCRVSQSNFFLVRKGWR